MKFVIIFIFLFLIILSYLKLAKFYNIIDNPNERGLHSKITIRGGGIIFPVSGMIYFILDDFANPYFYMGLFLISTISFLDDIYTLPNRYRLIIQFLSVFFLIFETTIFHENGWLIGVILLIMGVGIINAYNFMDGINGITGGYSMIIIIALLYVNNFYKNFINNDFIIFVLISLLVFNFFNFRKNAVCFAGDVGSISIAFIILFLIIKISIVDNNPIYILFLGVYGVDSVLTIINRIMLRQNIFKAHRLHLFQVIVYHKNIPHLMMSSCYMIIQAIICWIVISNLRQKFIFQLLQGACIIITLGLIYILVKNQIIKQTIPLNN